MLALRATAKTERTVKWRVGKVNLWLLGRFRHKVPTRAFDSTAPLLHHRPSQKTV